MAGRTIAEKMRIVNIALLMIAIPLLLLCLLRGLWIPAAAFALVIASNGYQMATSNHRRS